MADARGDRIADDDDAPAGSALGLPATGPGSVASLLARTGAYVVDSIASALIAALFVPDLDDARRGLLTVAVFVLQYLLLGTLTGSTLGMRLLGLRIAPVRSPAALPGFVAMCLRSALLVLLVPAVITDRDGRGLHDKAARTVVLRTR